MSLNALAFRYGSGANVFELFLDIVCPFSAKQFKTLFDDVFPSLPANVTFVFRSQVQPWHPSSTLVHESLIAVSLLQPDKFWEYTRKLFEVSDKFYDSHTVDEARSATYYRLSRIASSVGVNESKFLDLLTIKGLSHDDTGKNGGNKVTDLLKLQIKYGRQNGIHVSPSIVVNGLIDPSISSSFTKKDWSEYFSSKL